jgi:crotonobetainyl-CoA:carnitine CoA-transferase CaiB-like acyl-CoA transferase
MGMTKILDGVRILEVAEHTFVPAASAALADLGAEVIKIEHVERGDGMRGLAASGIGVVGGKVHALLEHSNRGKKSLGLDLTQPEGLDVLYRLAATCDVFLTNKLPGVRKKLNVDVDQIREHNPKIIYVRGTGQGPNGPDADKGSYDSLAFWARTGAAQGCTRPDEDEVTSPPAPGYGDSIGAITIAGAIMGALYHRERTGEPTEIDVSLLGTGMWAMGQAIALSQQLGIPWTAPPKGRPGPGNPLTRNYVTKDGRTLAFTCLQAGKYWAPMCEVIGRPELIDDERFSTQPKLIENNDAAVAILNEVFASATLDEWRERLEDFSGQWAVVQHTLEVVVDPQAIANGYMQDCATADGTEFQMVAVPMQFDNEAAATARAPEFNEHGDEILESIGLDWDQIVDLKVKNVVA